MTYTLHCGLCQHVRPISRAEVETFAVGQLWPRCCGQVMYLRVSPPPASGKEQP